MKQKGVVTFHKDFLEVFLTELNSLVLLESNLMRQINWEESFQEHFHLKDDFLGS